MGTRLQVHAREKPNLPICAYEIGDLEIIILVQLKKKKVEFSALSDAAGPEKQGIYLPRPKVIRCISDVYKCRLCMALT